MCKIISLGYENVHDLKKKTLKQPSGNTSCEKNSPSFIVKKPALSSGISFNCVLPK